MKKYIMAMAKAPSRGVFWIVDGQLLAYPYNDDSIYLSDGGITFNHRKLWISLYGKRGKPYNYYPRGRVDFTNRGEPIIYANPNIDKDIYLSQIRLAFGLREDPIWQIEGNTHYKCYLDPGWIAD